MNTPTTNQRIATYLKGIRILLAAVVVIMILVHFVGIGSIL